MKQLITRREMLQAQLALIIAIALQFVVLKINEELLLGPQFVLIPTEIALAVLVGFTVNRYLAHKYRIHHAFV
jgi:hypothetical protein